MGWDAVEVKSVGEALRNAEKEAAETNQPPDLEEVLTLAQVEAYKPSVVEAWGDFEHKGGKEDLLFPSHRLAELVVETSEWEPEAVGHALVLACVGGHIRCVRALRELQAEFMCGSMLVSLFNAFGLLKAAEAGKADIVEELLQRQLSASTAMMGYMLATKWMDTGGTEVYPYVELPKNFPNQEWMRKLAATKAMLPTGAPFFQSGGWDIRGFPGLHENVHELIRAAYMTYLLWRVAIVAASKCHTEVFRILLVRRSMDNAVLAKALEAMESRASGRRGGGNWDAEVRRIVAERAKIDTLMYQLVEEYSTKNYHDAMLYTLWGHIQRGGRDHPAGLGAGNPRCVAQASNGIWEVTLEVPLLMMPVEYALQDEEPFRRYKQLTLLFNQRAKVNIQLLATLEAQPSFLQMTVGIKHVRFKAENSRWDGTCMGHFPSVVTLSVMPQTTEGTSVTMTNSSSNTSFKVGKAERIAVGAGVTEGISKGLTAALRASGGVSVASTMKSTPWRFEQLPLADDRGGSFVWTLQAMKGRPFDRANPYRMEEANSVWKFGRRVPGNPLDQLPFTSEGGIQFTAAEFADAMIWRFPTSMVGKKLRWSIAGQIHSTFTTSRYFETRVASFSGDIEEPLVPLEDKKDKDKGDKKDKDKGEKKEKKDKDEDGEKSEKKEKKEKKDKDKEKDKDEDGEKSEKKEKKEKKDKDKEKDKDKDGEKSEKKEKKEKKDKDEDGEKSEKKEKKEKKDKDEDEDGEKSEKKEKKGKSEDEDTEESTKKVLSKLDTTTRNEFEEWLEFKRYREEQKKKKAQMQKASNEKSKPKPVQPTSADPPENEADAPTTSQHQPEAQAPEKRPDLIDLGDDQPKLQEVELKMPNLIDLDDDQPKPPKKVMSLKLDLDGVQGQQRFLTNRPSQTRAQGYNGRWLGSPEMEPQSPSPVQLQANQGMGTSGMEMLSPPRMPLGSIIDDDDLYKNFMPSRAGQLEREQSGQRIKGFSVRSVRSSRSGSADMR